MKDDPPQSRIPEWLDLEDVPLEGVKVAVSEAEESAVGQNFASGLEI